MQHTIKTSNSPCEEEHLYGIQRTDGSECSATGDTGGGGGDIDNTAGDSSSPNTKQSLCKQGALNKIKPNNVHSVASTKVLTEGHDIKKEEPSSPVSQLGFVTNSGISHCENDDRGTNIPLNASPSTFPRSISCNDLEENSTSASVNIPGSSIDGCGLLNTNIRPKSEDECVAYISNLSKNLNTPIGNNNPTQQRQAEKQGLLNATSHNSEFLQPQNHVFVFSTQLANKSAEAVLSGQFPTIIAYHYMQPSTKLFLEDFLKNPSRASKLQRQYSLNIMNAMNSAGGGGNGPCSGSQPYWLNECNNSGTPSNRLGLDSAAGPDKTKPLWDETMNPFDLLGANEYFENAKAAAIIGGMRMEDRTSMIPSLQGIKVPDENLTPQQRQHREEQLAKLKKMNKFLFPENDSQTLTTQLTAAGPSGNSADGLHNPSGNCPDASNKMFQQSLRHLRGNVGSEPSIPSGGLQSSSKQSNLPKTNLKDRTSCDAGNEQSNRSANMAASFGMADKSSASEGNIKETMLGSSNLNTTQDQWNKFQNNSFPDNLKSRETNIADSQAGGGPTLSRSMSMGSSAGVYSVPPSRSNTTTNNDCNKGPLPPSTYQQTQRSASVRIATPSPTNVNSSSQDMSLTSPQRTNPDVVANTSGNTTQSTQSNATTSSGIPGPSNNGGSSLHTLPPPMTSEEMDSLKSKEISPQQKFKGHNGNDIPPNNSCMDVKYNNFHLNYPAGGNVMAPTVPQNMQRHSMQQMAPQLCRRIDNMPLNPNCNRLNQNKSGGHFDPISSLAQMSQQLTGCGMGLNSMGPGGAAGGGLLEGDDLLLAHSGHVNDRTLGHCNQFSNANHLSMMGMGMSGGGANRPGQFHGDMNSMLCGERMDGRMLNGKMYVPNMAGHFNPNSMNGNLDDHHDLLSPNRQSFGRRLSTTSSNVQIKANAPNTIQYMPVVRSQNINNMRMAPNNDFFQSYSNQQIMGNVGANMMNMFASSNQMQQLAIGMGGDVNRGFEPHDLELEGNLHQPTDDYMNVH